MDGTAVRIIRMLRLLVQINEVPKRKAKTDGKREKQTEKEETKTTQKILKSNIMSRLRFYESGIE